MINWASSEQGATLVVTTTGDVGSTLDASTHDNNLNTAGISKLSGVFPTEGTCTYTITFAQTVTVEEFYLKVASTPQFSGQTQRNVFYWGYYAGGAWTPYADRTFTGTEEVQIIREKIPTGLSGVSRMRLAVTDYLNVAGNMQASGTVYEIKALGSYYVDKGLRYYDGSDVISLACESLSGHPVRMRASDGITYGVPLVLTTHIQASNCYFYDGTSVKAFVDIT